MSNSNEAKLFKEFSPVSRGDWEATIQKDLKGADYQKKLIWKTLEGFDVKPFYCHDDIADLSGLQSYPGEFPWIRGRFALNQSWLNRQDIKVCNVRAAAEKAVRAIEKGAGSVAFILPQDRKLSKAEISVLLENIDLKTIEINFVAGENSMEIIGSFFDEANKLKDKSQIKASFDFDPIGYFTISGNFYEKQEDSFDIAKILIEKSSEYSGLKVIEVNGRHFQNAGSSLVQELAFSLSIGNEYISRLTEKGLGVDMIASKMKFGFAIGSNYFMEIAKIRAARLLWAKLIEVWGGNRESAYMQIHSTTARFNKSVYDPYTNMLRTTTESMSAIIGGADSVTVEPFDILFCKGNGEISERIARNTQIVLKEEAYLDKIKDPAAGSYYIESLTASVANESWKLFLLTEEKGGFIEAFKEGFVQQNVEDTAKIRMNNISMRKETILGLNQYPNNKEKIAGSIEPEVFYSEQKLSTNPLAAPIKLIRGGREFENMRFRTEKHSKTPVVFLLTFGNVTMRRARAEFASNFFGCAGFQVIDNIGFAGIEEGLNAAHNSKAEIIVLCSSDEEYLISTTIAGKQLAGKAVLGISGFPKDNLEQLKLDGAKYFIHVRSNLLETLSQIQNDLGIK